MNYRQVKARLKKWANGRHHALKREDTVFFDGDEKKRYCLYISGFAWVKTSTWESAFNQLRTQIVAKDTEKKEVARFDL
jgi:hypothetical protein